MPFINSFFFYYKQSASITWTSLPDYYMEQQLVATYRRNCWIIDDDLI